jgi:murein DD-endopeptidase MepM/ murein hydrolase activator NlpD
VNLGKSGVGFFLFSIKKQLHLIKECGVKKYFLLCYQSARPQIKQAGREAKSWSDERRLWMTDSATERATKLKTGWKDLLSGKSSVVWPAFLKKPVFYGAVLTGFLLLGGTCYLTQNSFAYAAFYAGRPVGIVASRSAGQALVARAASDLGKKIGSQLYLPGELTYKSTTTSRADLLSQGAVLTNLKSLPWIAKGVQLCVNGKPVLVFGNREKAQESLNRLKKTYQNGLTGEKIDDEHIVEQITFKDLKVSVKDLPADDKAFSLLKDGKVQPQKYVVQAGDTLWSIARAHDLLVADLYQANSGLANENLSLGQPLQLLVLQPLLTIESTGTMVANESVPFDTQVKMDKSMRRGSVKVLQNGTNGQAAHTYQIVKHNDRVVVKNLISDQVLQVPVAKIVAEGSGVNYTVAYSGRGYSASGASTRGGHGFIGWPVNGHISKGYYGSAHPGIEIECGIGTPVGAAAAGRVVKVQYSNVSYGNMILIDHGNGMVTRYAHLSRISVSAGQSVGRGQVIGASGASGNVTGPHLHFEVDSSSGGSYNPFNYL